MDLTKVFEKKKKNDINQEQIFELARDAKDIDLENDEEIRALIRRGALLAGKSIDQEKEDKMVELVKEKGVTPELLELL